MITLGTGKEFFCDKMDSIEHVFFLRFHLDLFARYGRACLEWHGDVQKTLLGVPPQCCQDVRCTHRRNNEISPSGNADIR